MISAGYIFVAILGLLKGEGEDKQIKIHPPEKHHRDRRICETHACNETAKQILSSMDTSVNPCDDFYRFACGKFVDTAEIHDDKTDNSTFAEVDLRVEEQLKRIISEPPKHNEPAPFRSLKRLFSLCMSETKIDSRGVSPALAKLKAVGGWPVLGNWTNKHWNIQNILDTYVKLRDSMMGHNSLFHIEVQVDIKNNSRHIIAVDQPILGLAQEFLLKGPNDSMVQAYFSLMVDTAILFGAKRKTALEELRLSLYFEIELAKIMTVKEERRDYSRLYNLYRLPELAAELGWDGGAFLQRMMEPAVKLSRDELIIVGEVQYMKKLTRLLKSQPVKVVVNYLMWHAVQDMMNLLTDEMRDRFQQYRKTLYGTSARRPRWRECMDVVYGMSTALSSLYVRKFFDKNSKEMAAQMTEKIRQEASKLIKNVDWMDHQTREKAEYKASKMVQHIGYPDELTDDRKIEEMYKGLVLNQTHFFEAYFDLARWADHYNSQQLREPVNESDWRTHGNVATANAWYNPAENSITFPAGFLQPPFFNAKVPGYVNYGRMGMVVGHEIIHGFDDQGGQFDFRGNLHNWWDEKSRNSFNKKKQCIIDQYSAFKEKKTKLHLNGVNTQGENMADNAGVKLAYSAYKRLHKQEPGLPHLERYSNDQLFMLSVATTWCVRTRLEALMMNIIQDVHAPAEFRVKGPFMNLPAFAEVFHCKPGTPMNPHKKCSVW